MITAVLVLVAAMTATAEARYCQNPACRMCNSIWGLMPGYAYQNGRVVRIGRYAPRTTSRTTVPAKPASPDLSLVSTPHEFVEAILDVINVRPGDQFLDLGCGDGRFLIAAAKRGALAIGLELNHKTATLARDEIRKAGVHALVVEHDAQAIHLGSADVVVMYLFPDSMPSMESAKPGMLIVSIHHEIPGVKARKLSFDVEGESHTVFVFRVPSGESK